jgi:ATP/maltotriose-dependent transcriptional regulator MalT
MRESLAEVRSDAPRALDGSVQRPRLAHRLAPAPETLVGLVVAPSGYGKTVFLRQWAQADDRPCHWLQLRAQDRAPVRLLEAITNALGDRRCC